jgi:hypothetical protein
LTPPVLTKLHEADIVFFHLMLCSGDAENACDKIWAALKEA